LKKVNNHTFAICAYKESKYLEDCIKSLKKQTIDSNIIICTSTPNDYIKNLSKKYNLKLFINKGKSGIGNDWNFAVSKVKTDLCTIAHQDDIYEKNYLEEIINACQKYSSDSYSIVFGNYRELKNGKVIDKTINLKIKEMLQKKLIKHGDKKSARIRALKYGNSICCPCVTLNKKVVGDRPYCTNFKSNIDWETWYNFAVLDKRFIYLNKEIMEHRIHEDSTTSELIENNERINEDYEMFLKFWPKPIAKFFMYFYKNAVKTNG